MKTLTVNIDDKLSEKAITSVLDALKLPYEIDEVSTEGDETELIKANTYLSDKLTQGKLDIADGKGTTIAIDDLWK